MRLRGLFGGIGLVISTAALAWGQFRDTQPKGPRLGNSSVVNWQAGMVITAESGPCRGLVGTATIPVDWPEQEVRIVEEDFSPAARVTYRTVEGTVRQMVVQVPFLPTGETCRAVVTVQIQTSSQLPPEDTDLFVWCEKRKLPREVRPYLGPSPGIESTSSRIRGQARKLAAAEEKAWDRVKAIHDWVVANVELKPGKRKGAAVALREQSGDHEDLTSLFIALCRAAGVPARTVWVPNDCYAEFYLEDDEGDRHWFPCALAGKPVFGEMPDPRPILQKGDNFPSPHDRRERKRFLPETLDGAGGRPTVQFIRQMVAP